MSLDDHAIVRPANNLPQDAPLVKAYEYLMMYFLTAKSVAQGTIPLECLRVHETALELLSKKMSLRDMCAIADEIQGLLTTMQSEWMMAHDNPSPA
jgi:hypothetical protein